MSEAVDNASSLVSCGRSGGACVIVEVKLVGRVVAEPCCATENTGGELAGNIGVELMEGCGGSEAGVDVCCIIGKGFCCNVCDKSGQLSWINGTG